MVVLFGMTHTANAAAMSAPRKNSILGILDAQESPEPAVPPPPASTLTGTRMVVEVDLGWLVVVVGRIVLVVGITVVGDTVGCGP